MLKKVRKFKHLNVSVLIANYNNEQYLNQCIDSIKKQKYQNVEIIIHDDASSDNSIKKLNEYKNIKIIKNKKRGKYGSYNQMNAYYRAFKKSSGEIVFLLDSDDLFKKNKIKIISDFFSNNKKISSLFDLPIFKYRNKLKFIKNKKKIISNYWPYIPPQSCIAMKREHFIKIFKMINFNLFPDIWMDFRIGLYLKYIEKNFFIIDKNLTYYRQSHDMISSNFSFLSFAWWKRRKQAHDYAKYFFERNKILHVKNLDYLLTNFIYFFIK
jgi:glycosyltransferase involved in cell wall biosynthesis